MKLSSNLNFAKFVSFTVVLLMAGCGTSGNRIDATLMSGVEVDDGNVKRSALFKVDDRPCFVVATITGQSIIGEKMACQTEGGGTEEKVVQFLGVVSADRSMPAGAHVTFVVAAK